MLCIPPSSILTANRFEPNALLSVAASPMRTNRNSFLNGPMLNVLESRHRWMNALAQIPLPSNPYLSSFPRARFIAGGLPQPLYQQIMGPHLAAFQGHALTAAPFQEINPFAGLTPSTVTVPLLEIDPLLLAEVALSNIRRTNAATHHLVNRRFHSQYDASRTHLNLLLQGAPHQLLSTNGTVVSFPTYDPSRNHSSRLALLLQSSAAPPLVNRRQPRANNGEDHQHRREALREGYQQRREGFILYTPEDEGKLSEHQILLRRQIEYFRATQDDILTLMRGRNKPIVLQQVGLRCRHCSHLAVGKRKKGATYFPSSIMGTYQAAHNIGVEHLKSGVCPALPRDVRERLVGYESGTLGPRVASGTGKKYWAEAGRKMGLSDTVDGIRFASDVGESTIASRPT